MLLKRVILNETEASVWLRVFLAKGPKTEKQVLHQGIEAGHTWDTLIYAARLLQVRRFPRNLGATHGVLRQTTMWTIQPPVGMEEP